MASAFSSLHEHTRSESGLPTTPSASPPDARPSAAPEQLIVVLRRSVTDLTTSTLVLGDWVEEFDRIPAPRVPSSAPHSSATNDDEAVSMAKFWSQILAKNKVPKPWLLRAGLGRTPSSSLTDLSRAEGLSVSEDDDDAVAD
jgi:hypothetical protein